MTLEYKTCTHKGNGEHFFCQQKKKKKTSIYIIHDDKNISGDKNDNKMK